MTKHSLKIFWIFLIALGDPTQLQCASYTNECNARTENDFFAWTIHGCENFISSNKHLHWQQQCNGHEENKSIVLFAETGALKR